MKKLIYPVIFVLLLIGSHNYQELNNIAIITNIAIEKDKDNYKVIFQEITPKYENNNVTKDYKYYINTNSNLKSAFNGIDGDITKEIYLEHLENIIIKDNNTNIIYKLENILNSDLDNFNIILSETDTEKILKYSNNYKYINSIIHDNTTLRSIKKSKLENKSIKVPVVKIIDDKLVFYKYKKIGANKNG